MQSEFMLEIYEGGEVVEKVKKQTDTRISDLIKTLDEFQRSANAALTKLIEKQGDSTNTMEEEDEELSEDGEENDLATPKKKKK